MVNAAVSLEAISRKVDEVDNGGKTPVYVDLAFSAGGSKRYEIGYVSDGLRDERTLALSHPGSASAEIDFTQVASFSIITL